MSNKYGAVKVNGYDSKKEARRADELRLMERAGRIKDLRMQVPFELIPAMYEAADGSMVESPKGKPLTPYRIHKHGLWCRERSCMYVADFVYVDCETGEQVVEDVKSPATRTKEYVIKRKLMLWKYGIKINEI